MSIEVGSIIYVTNPTRDLVSPAFVSAINGPSHTLLFYNGTSAVVDRNFLGLWPQLTSDLLDSSISPCPAEFFLEERADASSSSTDFDIDIDPTEPRREVTPLPSKLEQSASLIEGTTEKRKTTLRRLTQRAKQRLPGKKIPPGQPVKAPRPRESCCCVQ